VSNEGLVRLIIAVKTNQHDATYPNPDQLPNHPLLLLDSKRMWIEWQCHHTTRSLCT
jgi:hypothetical protein